MKIIVERREKLPMGYSKWKPLITIDYDVLKKVTSHTFTKNLRIRLEE